MTEISSKDWNDKISFVFKQTKQMMSVDGPFGSHVYCGCLKRLKPHQIYKCLYCEEAYCKKCAEKHFGKTIDQHRIENPITNKEQ